MAKALGVTVSAIAITAGFHIAQEEGRGLMHRLRAAGLERRASNIAVLRAMLARDDIPSDLIRYLQTRRDVFHDVIELSADPKVKEEIRTSLREAMRDLVHANGEA